MNHTYRRYIRTALGTGLAVVTALLTACGGGSSNSAAAKALDGFDALVASSVLPSNSTQCPSGGTRLDSGADTNRNKVLDATEITGTQYVCNGTGGSAGSNALVQMLTEPVGSNCSIGGTKIVAGLDSNANNKLDASEITSTAYVCNGSNGTNGSNGLSTLMNTATESAGSNCASGGKKSPAGSMPTPMVCWTARRSAPQPTCATAAMVRRAAMACKASSAPPPKPQAPTAPMAASRSPQG